MKIDGPNGEHRPAFAVPNEAGEHPVATAQPRQEGPLSGLSPAAHLRRVPSAHGWSRVNLIGHTSRISRQAMCRRHFLSNHDLVRREFERKAARFKLSRAQIKVLEPSAPVDDVTKYFDARADRMKTDTVRRCQDHVADAVDARVPIAAFYVSCDIANLRGLNRAMGSKARANRHVAAMADIVFDELAKTGADVNPMRTGGDELGVVVAGEVTEAEVRAAMQSARERIEAYAREHKLDKIPHTKRDGKPGVRMHMGLAEVLPELPLSAVFTLADLEVDRSKHGIPSDAVHPAAESPNEDVAEAVGEDLAAVEPEAPLDNEFVEWPTTTGFLNPDAMAKAEFAEKVERLQIDNAEEVVAELAPRAPRDYVTCYFDARLDKMKVDVIRRARTFVRQRRRSGYSASAFYVACRIRNLGGLNNAVNNVADSANRHYRAMAAIVAEEMAIAGADMVPMRTGGKELGILVVGKVAERQVREAMKKASERLDAYARENGLAEIPHPERADEKGVGIDMGLAEVWPKRPLYRIFKRAEIELNRREVMSEKERSARLGLAGLTPQQREARMRELERKLEQEYAQARAKLEARRAAGNKTPA
jgi:hypothetical protein